MSHLVFDRKVKATPTKWVLTIKMLNDPEHRVAHAMASEKRFVEKLRKDVGERFGEFVEMTIDEMPVTWECDGRDNCRAFA